MDLDDDHSGDTAQVLDWRSFYSMIPKDFNKDSFLAGLNNDA